MPQSVAHPIHGFQLRALTERRGGEWSGVIYRTGPFAPPAPVIRVAASGADVSEITQGLQSGQHLTAFRDAALTRYGFAPRPVRRFCRLLRAAHQIAVLVDEGASAEDAFVTATRDLTDLTLRDMDDLHHAAPHPIHVPLENAA